MSMPGDRLRVVQHQTPRGPVREAIRAAQAAATRILADLEDGTLHVTRDAWRFPFDVARAIRSVSGITKETDVRLLLTAARAAHEALAIELVEHDFADVDHFCERFQAVWPTVHFGEGEGPVEEARRRALAAPLTLKSMGASPKYAQFVALAYHLQAITGADQPIFLPGRRIGAVLGVSHAIVHTWITLALREGYLELVDGTYTRLRARRFRFVSRVDGAPT